MSIDKKTLSLTDKTRGREGWVLIGGTERGKDKMKKGAKKERMKERKERHKK